MYICVCNAIRESDLRRTARLCPGDAEACYAAMGKVPNCCACLDEAEDVIDEERNSGFAAARAA